MSLKWAAEDSFYITLPSHDPGLRYVDSNTPARYSIALSEKLVLETNQWEVGMSEIFIPDYGYNIRSPRERSFKITYERVIQDEDGLNLDRVNAVDYIAILEGRYTAKTWVRTINERLKETVVDELTRENLFQGCLHYHEAGVTCSNGLPVKSSHRSIYTGKNTPSGGLVTFSPVIKQPHPLCARHASALPLILPL